MQRTKGRMRGAAVAAAFAAAISGPTAPAHAAPVAGPIESGPALGIVKAADQTAVLTSEAIDYHVTITNTGDVDLTNVIIDDPNAPDCNASVGILAVGAGHTVHCTYVTDSGDQGTYTNVATADSTETAAVASNPVAVTVTPRRQPDFTIKRLGEPFRGAGLFNADAVAQHIELTRRPGGVAVVRVRLTNPTDTHDLYLVRRLDTSRNMSVRYIRGRTAPDDITDLLTSGEYRVTLFPEQHIAISVEMLLSPRIRSGVVRTVTLQVRSYYEPTHVDTVRVTVTVP